MKNIYIYNVQTSKIHIKDYCGHCDADENNPNSKYKFFPSEAAVYKEYGNSVSMCKHCSKKRDKVLAKNNAGRSKR